MTTTNTYGRQVVIPLANKSGGAVAAGDVVVVDTSNNDAFTTTTSAGFTGGIGIAQEAIANNATGRVLISGYAPLINVNASVTRGHFGATHTVAKQAAGSGSRGAGTFCQFLTGGTTPDALVYPSDLAAAALVDPMTTRGDIIVRNAANATARLAAGAAGSYLRSDGTDPSWYAPVYTDYTPTLSASVTPPTLGSGSSARGRYMQFGKRVTVHGAIIFGTSGVVAGSGVYSISLPVTQRSPVNSDDNAVGYGWLLDSSATATRGVIYLYGGTTIVNPFTIDGSAFVTNAAPWTWAASDQLVFHFDYEAA